MIVLVRFFVRLAVSGRFSGPLRPLLGPFWDALGITSKLIGANFAVRGCPFGSLFALFAIFYLYVLPFSNFQFSHFSIFPISYFEIVSFLLLSNLLFWIFINLRRYKEKTLFTNFCVRLVLPTEKSPTIQIFFFFIRSLE